MKKLYVILLAAMLVVTYPLSTFAFENNNPDTVSKNDYVFDEHIDNSGRIHRYYEKKQEQSKKFNVFGWDNSLNQSSNNEVNAKEILLLIGLQDDFIDELSMEQLELYANAQSITSVTTYSISDERGNIKIIDKDFALQNAPSIMRAPPTFPEDLGDGNANLDSEFGSFDDSFMSLTYLVAELGDGKFHHSVNASWLLQPSMRKRDLIGACVENNNINYASATGWFKYYTHNSHQNTNNNEDELTTITFTSSNRYVKYHDGWTGCAAFFELPTNSLLVDMDGIPYVYHYNFNVHFEFDSSVSNPSDASTFNSTASYDHITIYDNGNGSQLLISNSKKYIGFDMSDSVVDRRHVDLANELEYSP